MGKIGGFLQCSCALRREGIVAPSVHGLSCLALPQYGGGVHYVTTQKSGGWVVMHCSSPWLERFLAWQPIMVSKDASHAGKVDICSLPPPPPPHKETKVECKGMKQMEPTIFFMVEHIFIVKYYSWYAFLYLKIFTYGLSTLFQSVNHLVKPVSHYMRTVCK